MSKIKTLFIVAMAMIMHVAVAQDSQLIKHQAESVAEIGGNTYDISEWNAMCIDDVLNTYMNDDSQSEGKAFYLEGGKAYFITSYVNIYKGMTLETNPDDIKAGKPKAILYMGGITKNGSSANTANFMLGRQIQDGEDPYKAIEISDVRFRNLDVQVPLAGNYGTQYDGTASVSNNYFLNMYSNCIGFNLSLLEWDNCTFQGFIRGFFRVQGRYDLHINKMKLTNCQFYNNGYYSSNGRDYSYIHADLQERNTSNVLMDVEVANNVFYDNPKSSIINDGSKTIVWDESIKWKINVHHNTIVNFNTCSAQPILNTYCVPGGSELAFHDNLIILTRDANDVNRNMICAGWVTRYIQDGDGSDHAYFKIYNNWSTNDNLTNGQVFSSNAFSSTSNAPGKYVTVWKTEGVLDKYFPYGEEELVVKADNIKATDLMVSPNPKYFIGTTASGKDHHTDTGIEGLMYQQTDKVKNSLIYKLKVGAPMLWGEKKDPESDPKGVYGDVNGDGVVDIDDVTEVINVICGK